MPDLTVARSGCVALALALAVAGCGSSGRESSPPSETTPTVETAPPATTPSEEAAVVSTLDRYWDIWLASNHPTNPDDPKLAEVLTGDALQQTVDNMRSRQADGQDIEMAPNPEFRHHVEVVEFDTDSSASATECVVDDTQLTDISSHRVINGDVATYELRKTLVADTSRRWRISKSVQIQRWDGVAGCASSN